MKDGKKTKSGQTEVPKTANRKAGGKREGSGRPKGTGQYGEPTQAIRIPISLLAQVKELIAFKTPEYGSVKKPPLQTIHHLYPGQKQIKTSSKLLQLNERKKSHFSIPLFSTRIAAGHPSLADDDIEEHLDLNSHLVEHPADTFLVRVQGDSMINAGIYEGDILIVDRSIKVTNHKIVVAVLNNELTVKRLELKKDSVRLLPENERYKPITITEEMNFLIRGVVLHVIHSV